MGKGFRVLGFLAMALSVRTGQPCSTPPKPQKLGQQAAGAKCWLLCSWSARSQPGSRCQGHGRTELRGAVQWRRAESKAPMGKAMRGGEHGKAPRLTDCDTENAHSPCTGRCPGECEGVRTWARAHQSPGRRKAAWRARRPWGRWRAESARTGSCGRPAGTAPAAR